MGIVNYLTIVILINMIFSSMIDGQGLFNSMRLDREKLKFFFTEQRPSRYLIVNAKSRTREVRSTDSMVLNPNHLDLTLEDETGKLELELYPSDEIISSHFKLVVRNEDGRVESETVGFPKQGCLYRGSAKGRGDTTAAALSSCDGKGFTGVYIDGEHSHLIRPLNGSSKSRHKRDGNGYEDALTEDGLHIITPDTNTNSKCAVHDLRAMRAPEMMVVDLEESERSENIWHRFYNSDMTNEKERKSEENHLIFKRQSSKKYKIETAVFTDGAMYDFIKGREENAVEELENIVLTIMNGVNIIYTAPSMRTRISVQVTRLEIMKSSSNVIDSADGDISLYLSNFCLWQHRQKKGKIEDDWDHGLLISGINLWDRTPSQNGVIGLAWVGGMCNSLYSCTINEGTSFEAQFVIAHEMGHNLNMSHDGSLEDGNSCSSVSFLMSPSTGPGKLTWSVCSNRELEKFLKEGYRTSCLERSQTTPTNYTKHKKLPGEKYDIAEQCIYAYGQKFKPYVTSKNPYEDVCRELWCQNRTHALRSHPALEGSTCSQNKHCINGICQRKLNIPSGEIPNRSEGTTKSTTESESGRRSSFGFTDFIKNIRDLFKKYFLLKQDPSSTNLLAAHWRLLNTTSCTKVCGGGWKTGKAICTNGSEGIVLKEEECNGQKKPARKTSCNTFPCQRHKV